MRKIVLVTLAALSLQSCVFVVGAGAGAAAVAAVYDHRKLARIHEDESINNQILRHLTGIHGIKEGAHINVTTFNNVVLLTGEAINSDLRNQAGSVARSIDGVSRVYNEIAIMGPSSSLSRTSDAWITGKIKAEMIGMKELQSGSIKVVTENGVVYLMGNVSREQAENAVDIAREVSGVQKVIKIFEYTDGAPATAPTAQATGLGEPQPIIENTTVTSNTATPPPAGNSFGETNNAIPPNG